MQPTNQQILDAIRRLEGKVDTLILALAEDEDKPESTLDGLPLIERDQSTSLD